MTQEIKIKLVKSPIGYNKKQRAVLTALGLRKINQEKVMVNNSAVRGMIRKVQHMLELSEA